MKRTLRGKVTSDRMEKTVVVLVESRKEHPIYRKKYLKTDKFMAHNGVEAKVGDFVIIEEIAPKSKNKKWNVQKIISAKQLEVE